MSQPGDIQAVAVCVSQRFLTRRTYVQETKFCGDFHRTVIAMTETQSGRRVRLGAGAGFSGDRIEPASQTGDARQTRLSDLRMSCRADYCNCPASEAKGSATRL